MKLTPTVMLPLTEIHTFIHLTILPKDLCKINVNMHFRLLKSD